MGEIEGDDGKIKKNLAEFRGQRGPTIDWTNAENREEFRNRIIDAICNMTGDTLDEGAKYEIK